MKNNFRTNSAPGMPVETRPTGLNMARCGLFIVMIFMAICNSTYAQTPGSCPNSGFNNGTFDNWTGCYGSFIPTTCVVQGFLTTPSPPQPPLHKIIGSAWTDANTNCSGNGLVTLFPGESFAARIGDTAYTNNPAPNYKAAEIKYAVNVVAGVNDFFICRHALVMQSGGHTMNQQPGFLVEIIDASGNLTDPVCGSYNYVAPTSGVPAPGSGWNLCGSTVYWRNWTTVGLNLTAYAGQTVYIRFKAYGCVFRSHFGYAYVSGSCSSTSMVATGCEGTGTVTMTAPPGFSAYEWKGPGVNGPVVGNSQTCTITAAQGALNGNIFYLKLTGFNGCVNTLQMGPVSFSSGTPYLTTVPVSKTINSGDHAAIPLTFSLPGAYATWTSAVIAGSAVITPIPAGQSGDFINDQIINTGTGDAVVIYSITPTTGTCTGPVQTFTVTVMNVPQVKPVQNLSVSNGQSSCFNASISVFVAGNGTSFLVSDGGSATMIAGENIIFYDGTTVQAGGSMLGYISPGGPYCPAPAMPAVAEGTEGKPGRLKPALNIYPNPTDGKITIELTDQPQTDATVEVFNMVGNSILKSGTVAGKMLVLSLENQVPGVYFVKVVLDEKILVGKIILQ